MASLELMHFAIGKRQAGSGNNLYDDTPGFDVILTIVDRGDNFGVFYLTLEDARTLGQQLINYGQS